MKLIVKPIDHLKPNISLFAGHVYDNCSMEIDCSAAVTYSNCSNSVCSCYLGYQTSALLTECNKSKYFFLDFLYI